MTTQFVRQVAGMSCQHCVRAISTHLRDVPGIQTVEVNLDNATVVVRGDCALSGDAVDAAIAEAGYQITG